MKCDLCNQPTTNFKNGKNVCAWHYNEMLNPNNFFYKQPELFKTCELCKDKTLKIHKHHTSYFPEKKIIICLSCHKKIHKHNPELCPSKIHEQIFYSRKGWITKSTWPFMIRELTPEEKIFKKVGK